jgi:hypothetical protein
MQSVTQTLTIQLGHAGEANVCGVTIWPLDVTLDSVTFRVQKDQRAPRRKPLRVRRIDATKNQDNNGGA